MKITSLTSVNEASGEDVVRFSEDLAEFHKAEEEALDRSRKIGVACVRAGMSYAGIFMGKQHAQLLFQLEKDDTKMEIGIFPYKKAVLCRIENDGEQRFTWDEVPMLDFMENTEGDIKRVLSEMYGLMDALDGAQKFIGSSPSFEN